MPTRADSLREYLTGAVSDGGVQQDPNFSLGGYYSSTEAVCMGILYNTALANIYVQYASGANPLGNGSLVAINDNQLTWQPNSVAAAGLPATFSFAGDIQTVEVLDEPGAYLRVQGYPPFVPGQMSINLSLLFDNVFGIVDPSIPQAVSGVDLYRATMLRSEGVYGIINLQRWISLLGTQRVSNVTHLGSSGSGVITTTGSLSDWPKTGWCQVRTSGGTLREVVYYSSRTSTSLTVPAGGRGLLGSTATAGSGTDLIHPVPGIAIGIDPTGDQAFGTSIQTIANGLTPPVGVTWSVEITAATGLQIGSLGAGRQVGVWIWRQTPPGALATPSLVNEIGQSFVAF